jgi:hypothetical protein
MGVFFKLVFVDLAAVQTTRLQKHDGIDLFFENNVFFLDLALA